jgi:enamine deaminase RidA (YjgF/YER057c/UK114 family)
VSTAGACPLDAGGATVAVADVSGRTEQVMANLRVALQAAGADPIDVMTATVYVATPATGGPARGVGSRQPALRRPRHPSTLLGVRVLGYRDQLVEIQAVAARA